MFSGRVNRGRYPSTTMRSKQWYTKATRLPNNFVNVSIGPPRSFYSHENSRAEDRWNQMNRPRTPERRAHGVFENFKYLWLDFRPDPMSCLLIVDDEPVTGIGLAT